MTTMKPRIKEPKYLSKYLSIYPEARISQGILERYHETDVFDLAFELRYMSHGGCFLAIECRKDEKWARQRLYTFGQGDGIVILGGSPEPFETYRFFDDDFVVEPEPLHSSPEEWHSAYEAYLNELKREGYAILGDFRSVELMHPALLGATLGSSSAQKPEVPGSKPPTQTVLPENHFKMRASEEITPRAGEIFMEGSVESILVNKYERDPEARRRCIEHYGGHSCQICLVDLAHVYPGIGKGGFIHVHHLQPLSSVGREHQVDPINDLLPVCPNCHAMLHRKDPPYTPEELRASFFGKTPPPDDDIPF